ncbi:MAG TPA: bacteriohopanetetrol glucosamine biosynthesis glycosyltransferase HpnI [Alphaproteobacteria bacterium]|nr:bacteriohopanetetrol glucosamine biosynthesis glycosyltransferase HpnI [Alphaproteobacteria bacterium]
MPHIALMLLTIAGYAIIVASLGYTILAVLRVAGLKRRPAARAQELPPITVLKPVCGLEPRLYEDLRSFCAQDYPAFQILFGVRDASDPAIPVIRRLIAEFPEREPALVIDPRVIGSNYKISNVANMLKQARHDILVIADADCRVGPGYLADLAAAFTDPAVGAATCLYRGTPARPQLASRLGAMFINEWFLPSVLVALISEPLEYCFGATMAVRRRALNAIGGIEALASYLADDHMLGRLVAAQGYKVALARHIVELSIEEPNLKMLFRHELRWARTMRTVRPLGYAFSFLTDSFPLSILLAAATGFRASAVALVGGAVLLRGVMHWVAHTTLGGPGLLRPWLVPLRDLITFTIRAASFIGRRVEWRAQKFSVQTDGQMVVNMRGAEVPE